jgi:type IV pilus assembly protein PilW
MVSAALGLLLTAGAIGVFLSSRQIYRTEEALSFNQENGRTTTEYLARKIRIAGYAGCSNLTKIVPFVIAEPEPTNGFDLNTAVIGYDNDGTNGTGHNWVNPPNFQRVDGTDAITVKYGGDCGADLVGNMDVKTAEIKIANGDGNCGFNAGDYLLLTDCKTADLFRASNVSESTGKITIAHASNVNSENFLSKNYQSGSTVYYYVQETYFIGTSEVNPNPGLYRLDENERVNDIDNSVKELIDNVQDMQLMYGIDSGGDGNIDSYETASDVIDWTQVLNVRINLLFRSDNEYVTPKPQMLKFNETPINGGEDADRRLRNIFTNTVTLRNRVP